MPPPSRVVNKRMAATSTVRLIEAVKPREPDQPPTVILKPKAVRTRLPGTALLIKIGKAREKEREKATRKAKKIDMAAVEEAVGQIMEDLEA